MNDSYEPVLFNGIKNINKQIILMSWVLMNQMYKTTLYPTDFHQMGGKKYDSRKMILISSF